MLLGDVLGTWWVHTPHLGKDNVLAGAMAELFEVTQEDSTDDTAVELTPVDVPDWVSETPSEGNEYILAMDHEGAGIQDIPLSRDEFEFLKRQLAIHRGLVPAERQQVAA